MIAELRHSDNTRDQCRDAKQHEKLIREVAGDYKNTDEEEGPQDLSE